MPRPIRIEGDIAYVPLTRGYEAIIDTKDVAVVAQWSWCTHISRRRADGSIRAVYAKRREKERTIFMHRMIAGTPDGFLTDHIDGDGLNNRRSNLRAATQSQNNYNSRKPACNTSGAKGVTWHKERGKWLAQIRWRGRNVYLGYFTDLLDAAFAYANASARLHGKFGRAR